MLLLMSTDNGPVKHIGIFDREGIETYVREGFAEEHVTIVEEGGDRFSDFSLWVEFNAPGYMHRICTYAVREIESNKTFGEQLRRW